MSSNSVPQKNGEIQEDGLFENTTTYGIYVW
jgi:hypothetical protein